MRKPLLLLFSTGLVSCLQVLGLDKYNEGNSGGAATTSSATGTDSSNGTGSGTTVSGNTASSSTGMNPPSYSAQAVTGGEKHTCALLTDGRIACWGNNDHGQLGDGTFKSSVTPVLVANIANAASVSAGGRHTCARLKTGEVRCWGANEHDQLGLSSASADQNQPVTPVGLPTTIGGISAGDSFTCAYAVGGKAYCWGDNSAGQLAVDTAGIYQSPKPISSLAVVKSIAAGQAHTCAVADTDYVWCWGSNSHLQAGGGSNPSFSPHQIMYTSLLTGMTYTDKGAPVSAALDTWCNLVQTNVTCGGRNDFGQAASTPGADNPWNPAGGVMNALEVAGGGQHFCARIQNGTVSCWGQNDAGQIGDGSDGNFTGTPSKVMGVADATAIGLGWRHSCAVISGTNGPAVVCWGANEDGQLGDGTMQEAKAPVPVKYLP